MKTVCKKFSGKTHDYGHVPLNGTNFEWVSF